MVHDLMKGKKYDITIYADIPGLQINGGTIPADILTTSQRPAIVLVNRKLKRIALLELSISFEKNIESANSKKYLHYLNLASDIRSRGWETENVPFEVGSRGQVTKRNKKSICDTTRKFNITLKKIKINQGNK